MTAILKVSSPGKIILHGEHAAVYGKLVLASSLNMRTYITLREQKDNVSIHLANYGLTCFFLKENLVNFLLGFDVLLYKEESEKFSKIIEILCAKYMCVTENSKSYNDFNDVEKLSLKSFLYLYKFIVLDREKVLAPELGNIPINNGLIFDIQSQIPIGVGLGSSGSYCVSMAAALLIITKQIPNNASHFSKDDLNLINEWSFRAETVIHGKPSGIDNSTSTFGGIVSLRDGQLEMLHSLDPRVQNLSILCANTNNSRNTRDLIERVRKRKAEVPVVVNSLLDTIEAITRECIGSLSLVPTVKDSNGAIGDVGRVDCFESRSGFTESKPNLIDYDVKGNGGKALDYDRLGLLMEMNHDILNALGVGHPSIEKVRHIIKTESNNSLHPKMTGAGGGGCLFALIPWEDELFDSRNEPQMIKKLHLVSNVSEPLLGNVIKVLGENGYGSFLTEICCPGVSTHDPLEMNIVSV